MNRYGAAAFLVLFSLMPFRGILAAREQLPREFGLPPAAKNAAAAGVRPLEASPSDIGSSNTVTAVPPVPHPNEAPCVVTLFAGTFAQYAPQTFAYAPPAACPGPFAKIVLRADFRVSAGVQFDRTASVELAGVPLYFGTTAEPGSQLSPHWHVERDVTDDAVLLARPRAGEVDIFNIFNATYTGVITATAYLQFYPATSAAPAAAVPDVVLPLPGTAGGPQHLPTATSVLAATYTLPRNVERAYLDVYAQSQQTDEQYFLCAPTALAAGLFTCPDTAFRETEISIDGRPAGVAPVYPWIYTGGLDPYLWFPLPGVQTLEFVPYRVDLTPFAAALANGKPHVIAFSVDDADNYFQGFATLYAYLDHGSKALRGALTVDTLTAHPLPSVVEHVSGTSPSIDGTIAVTDTRSYRIGGYVDTSHGRVTTSLASTVDFSNQQSYSNESADTGTVVVKQTTTDATTVVTQSAAGTSVRTSLVSYPLAVSLADTFDAAFTGTQTTTIDQSYLDVQSESDPNGSFGRVVRNEVAPSDTLKLTSGALSGNAAQKSVQRYSLFDTRGTCYTQTLTAAANVLTGVSNAPCDRASATRSLRALGRSSLGGSR